MFSRYFMYEPFIDLSGPSLGVLRVLLQTGKSHTLLPIWQLTNNQGLTWYYGQVPIRQNSSYKVRETTGCRITHWTRRRGIPFVLKEHK
jgi:hypothetical protein